jgi:hypothetical protein
MVDRALRIPPHARRRVGLPGGTLPLSISFGAPDPLAQPGGYEYEVSPEDRELFERAVRDSDSQDSLRATAAKSALRAALLATPLGAAAYFGYKVGNFLGRMIGLLWGEVSGSANKKWWVDPDHVSGTMMGDSNCRTGWLQGDVPAIRGIITRFSWTPKPNGRLDVEIEFEQAITNWHGYYQLQTGSAPSYWATSSGRHMFAGIGVYVSGDTSQRFNVTAGGEFVTYVADSPNGCDKNAYPNPKPNIDTRHVYQDGRWQNVTIASDGSHSRSIVRYSATDVGMPSQECNLVVSQSFTSNPAHHSARQVGPTGARNYVIEGPLPKDAPFELLTPLPGLEGLEDLPPGDPKDSDLTPEQFNNQLMPPLRDSPYNQNYGPGSGNPDPTLPTVPTVPVLPTPDPVTGEIPEPGTPGGVPLDPISGLPPLGSDLGNPTLDVPGGMGFDIPGCQDAFPGEPVRATLAGKSVTGKVGRYEPAVGDDPCHFVAPTPPYADENFTKPRCYRNKLAVEIARELAVELGLNPNTLVVEPGCTERFTGCFKKGSSKFDALWSVLDLCGYGVFPDPENPTIGPMLPLNVHHGPYHEDRNVFVFERAYDDLDMPSHVEYFRPAGKGLPRRSVVQPVITDYSLPHDKWETHTVPAGTSEDAMIGAARRRAAEVAARGNTATVAVPLNMDIAQRHQFEVRRPSKGISINYMVLSLRHDFADDGYVSLLEGRELKVVKYAPAPGTEGRSAR